MKSDSTIDASPLVKRLSRADVARAVMVLLVLSGACLLFQLEPLTGKIVTPRFGGTAGTWSVCLLFFQMVVLVGYGLTWQLSKLPHRTQVVTYVALALLTLCWSQIPQPDAWVNHGGDPGLEVLQLLLKHVSAPAIFLASLSGTLQVWYSRAKLGDPYPLYAVSNTGSLIALVSYPLLFEPGLSVRATLQSWSVAYVCLIALLPFAATAVWKGDGAGSPPTATAPPPPTEAKEANWLWWIMLSAAGSLVLMSYTAYITADVAPVPLLWVIPLSIYLLTFILAFSGRAFYRPVLFTHSWLFIACIEPALGQGRPLLRITTDSVLVFLMCMICHGELAASRPAPKHLPVFYWCMSLGGVIAGIFAALVAPVLFNFEIERFVALAMVVYITLVIVRNRKVFLYRNSVATYLILAAPFAGLVLMSYWQIDREDSVQRVRNFYSAVTIVKEDNKVKLLHGHILHGEQFDNPSLSNTPTTYYKEPVKLIDDFLRQESGATPMDIAAVGLGTGTLAAYGRSGDNITFFELDPKIKEIANTWFTFLKQSKAQVGVTLGDGRYSIEALPADAQFNLLFVDAFNGDAIPLHLLTREAMKTYSRHLKRNGLLVFHLSNKYISLPRPVASTARAADLKPILLQTPEPGFKYLVVAEDPSLISRLYAFATEHRKQYAGLELKETPKNTGDRFWSDDFADIFSAFRK